MSCALSVEWKHFKSISNQSALSPQRVPRFTFLCAYEFFPKMICFYWCTLHWNRCSQRHDPRVFFISAECGTLSETEAQLKDISFAWYPTRFSNGGYRCSTNHPMQTSKQCTVYTHAQHCRITMNRIHDKKKCFWSLSLAFIPTPFVPVSLHRLFWMFS